MGRAEFEENSLRWILNKCKTVAESAGILSGLSARTEEEFAAAEIELRQLAAGVREKLASTKQAQYECEKQFEAYRQSCDTTSDDGEADQSDGELERLEQICAELDSAVFALERVSASIQRVEAKLSATKSAFESEWERNSAALQRSVSRGECFYLSVENAYTKAMEIVNFRDMALPVQWHGDRYKIIRAGHEGIAGRNPHTAVAGSDMSVFARQSNESKALCVTLEAKSADEFFAHIARLGGSASFRIPSYDFCKIGGMEAMEELKRRGFEVKRDNGSIIGDDGYITWERQNEISVQK